MIKIPLWYSFFRSMGIQSIKLKTEKIALIEFKKQFPEEAIGWTKIIEEKDDGMVIGVAYGNTKPLLYKFYLVKDNIEVQLLDNYKAPAGFWPRLISK